MTQEEFNIVRFGKGMRIKHIDGTEGTIMGVDFYEYLIEVSFDGFSDTTWVRCENVELIT